MADKYIALDGTTGLLTSTSASVTTAANAIVAQDGTGKLDIGIMPTGLVDVLSVVMSEALTAGDFVNLYNNAGTLNARKAGSDSAALKEAQGFVIATPTYPGNANVYFSGPLTATSAAAEPAITAGVALYLDNAAVATGAVTATPPAGPDYVQFVGFARAASAGSGAAVSVGVRMDRPVLGV